MAKGFYKDETDRVYGRLTVIEVVLDDLRVRRQKAIFWRCKCICGKEVIVSGVSLRAGDTTSCGCSCIERCAAMTTKRTTHGKTKTIEYKIWSSMKARCNNAKTKVYADYGGRGITVCPEWLNSFETFYSDMGPRPSKDYSLDRKDNDKGYYKENCKWATRVEQQNNTRATLERSVPKSLVKVGSRYRVALHVGTYDTLEDAIKIRNEVLTFLGRAIPNNR